MLTGQLKKISSARLTEKINPIAHRKRIRARVPRYIATRVTALLRTLRSVREFLIRLANLWASQSWITTETTGWIFSLPMTQSRIDSTRTTATERLQMKLLRRA